MAYGFRVRTEQEIWVDESFADLDWYGRDLSGETYRQCAFRDIDLTEAVSRGANPSPVPS